ncbi:MAG: replication-associated recombination protein A [Phycisphaerae bacterium]|nr:replication-associated recombination protein A [Phycisphaerae bacterium]
MSDLWAQSRERARAAAMPLALRMRPRSLDEFEGQEHILGEGKLLRRMLSAGTITSLILHGPPGTGKTTLAELIARHTKRHFEQENASSVGVKRIREIIDQAASRLEHAGTRTMLFLDEIHRFTRSQQDVLLADVERGVVTLIGATTENPLFSVNSALVSRSTLFALRPLDPERIKAIVRRAAEDPERGFGARAIDLREDALDVWAIKCDGDARRALTALEVAVLSSLERKRDEVTERRSGEEEKRQRDGETKRRSEEQEKERGEAGTPGVIVIDRAVAEDSIQQKAAVYDGTGDEHYDLASAMIKSVRGSDPDAAVYWIARMLEGGEDPRFIARRLAILASEDIGNADPRAIMVAASAWELVERIGMPEARITLSQSAIYLALAPKSNASYLAIDEAIADVREGRTIPVPMHIKDGNVRKAQDLSPGGNRGDRYDYAHDHADGVGRQDYLGVEKSYYRPGAHGLEAQLAARLREIKALRAETNKEAGRA